jgi:transcriptional regulator with XRE-family HTH domain
LGYFTLRIDNLWMPRDHRYDLFEQALIETRLESNLTQEEVALRLNKPQSFVSKYESGERRLDIIELIDVCKALGKNLYDVLDRFYKKN